MVNPWSVHTGSGTVDIELYEPGTFDSEPIRIQTENGPMVPYVTDPADADTGIRVYTGSNGVQGINTVGILTVDDFEDGDRAGWNVPSSTGSDSVVTPGLNGTNYKWQHDGFREAHLAGADAQDRGPQPGDVFEFWFHVDSTSGSTINRFEFSADGINESDVYRIEFERETGDDEFSLEKISGGSQELVDTQAGHNVDVGQTYRCEVHWNDGDSNITAQLFGPGGGTLSNQLSISDSSSGDFAQPGIFIRTNGNNVCFWDEIRILPN